jgi:hypothetical protein
MCTITVLRAGDVLRVVCNRDERRDRREAHPPYISIAGRVRVLSPQDPQGGGTWVAATSAGLVFALMNVHPPACGGAAPRSRGLVIPSLADAASLEEVAFRMDDVRPGDYRPFRLVVADRLDVLECRVDGGGWIAEIHRIDRPMLFTSSSLGDAVVEGPRRLLFEQMLATPWDLAAQQDAFHAHRWRDRPAVSVHMSRPEACTVSTTTAEVTPRDVRMIYQPACRDGGTPVGLVIERRDVGSHAVAGNRRQYLAV